MMIFQKMEAQIREIINLGILSMDEIEFALNNMPCIHKTLNLNLYRVRVGTGFDIYDPYQFSYNHDIDKIEMQRYNRAKEAVLYTSTNPEIALKELKRNYDGDKLYIAVIHPQKETVVFNCALNINSDNLYPNSIAQRYYNEVRNMFVNSPQALSFFSNIGKMLEEDNDYNFSSNYASLLFQTYDSFITVSTVSNGKELNLTFNKETADKKLKLVRVFECEIPKNQQSLYFKVLRIGICSGDEIEWYKWEIIPESIECYETLNPYIPNYSKEKIMYPNVTCKAIEDDFHFGINNGQKVKYKIRLLKDKNAFV